MDTRTGDVLPLPVAGRVTGLLLGPDDNLLIRTAEGDGPRTLSVVQAREPAAVGDAELLGWNR